MPHITSARPRCRGCRLSQFETNGLKAMYFQGVETQTLSTRGVTLMSTCTALPRAFTASLLFDELPKTPPPPPDEEAGLCFNNIACLFMMGGSFDGVPGTGLSLIDCCCCCCWGSVTSALCISKVTSCMDRQAALMLTARSRAPQWDGMSVRAKLSALPRLQSTSRESSQAPGSVQ